MRQLRFQIGTILAINNDSIVASHDDGKTWALHSRTGHSTDVRVVRTRNGRLLASTASHLYASNDTGHSWSTSWEGIEGMTIGAMTVAPDGTIIVGGWNSAFHVRDQKTSEWRYITHNEQDPDWPLTHKTNVVTDFDYADSSMLFAATSGGTVLTTDNGITWRRLHSTPRPILDIAVSQKGIVLAAYNVFSGNIGRPYYRSEDFGKTWQNVDSRGVGSLFYSDRYDLLFSTDLDSRWRRDTVLWSSTDAGKTWQELEVAAPGGRYYIDHRTDDIYLIGERSSGETMKLWRSTDGGRSWRATPMEYGLRPGGGRDLAVTVDGDVYFVADTSLYAHIRGDSLFRRVEANGPALRIRGVEVMPDGRLLVDAGRTGLFLSSRSVLHVADKERATGSLTPLHYLGDARYRLEAAIGWYERHGAHRDLHGRRVFGAEGSLQLDADGVTIDLGGLPTGLYFLIVQKNGIEGSVHYALVRP